MNSRNVRSVTPADRRAGFGIAGNLWTLVLVSAVVLALAASIRRIAPDEIGIRIVNSPFGEGLVAKDFDAGFYRNIFLVESWDTLPRSVQRVVFTNRVDLRGPEDLPSIEAKTRDGDRITVEATVLFRIPDGRGHVVYQDSGRGDAFKRVARDIAGAEIPAAFATLATERIYDKEARRDAYAQLESTLREKLARLRHLELVKILITEVTFDPKYEEQLERKKVAKQREQLETSQKNRVVELNKKLAIIQETDNKVKKIQNDNRATVTTLVAENTREVERIRAEGTRSVGDIEASAKGYKAVKEAEATQLVREAEAYALAKQRAAMGDQGQNYVAYTAAQNFPVKSVVMPSIGIDWFSPMSLARFVGAALQGARSDDGGAGSTRAPRNDE